jgi:hypothetical protein
MPNEIMSFTSFTIVLLKKEVLTFLDIFLYVSFVSKFQIVIKLI